MENISLENDVKGYFLDNILSDEFLMETWHFIKTLALGKQKIKTYFLSTLMALRI